MTLDHAYAHCTALAREHYENFPVGRLVPARLAPHVHAVYAFARHADDLADEGYAAGHDFGDGEKRRPTPSERLEALREWERQLTHPDAPDRHPIFLALHHTMRELNLPLTLFTDLLSAFQQDVVKRRYRNFAEILDYCRRSANPIGRLVLLLHQQREPAQMQASDRICTALQLANFWQDVSIDLQKDRIYLPEEELACYGVSEEDLFAHRATPAFRRLLADHVTRARELFREGKSLCRTLPFPLNWEIRLTWEGGSRILDLITALDYDTLRTRPKLTKWAIPRLLFRAALPA